MFKRTVFDECYLSGLLFWFTPYIYKTHTQGTKKNEPNTKAENIQGASSS